MNPASASAIGNPFPGLRPFREEEEHLFFGRELQVDALVDKLAVRRFLAVVGTSGSGKSSLVNCGLRPALHQGRMASAGTTWRMAQFRPGYHPLAAMAQALAEDGVLFRNFEERGLPLVDIIDTTLRMSKKGLIDIYEQAALAQEVNLLVVVDQFEELFRYRKLAEGPQADGHGFSEEATAFVKLLLELQEQKDCPIFVVLTMRSDFLGDCTQFAGLAEAINAGLYLVPRLTPEERRDAIVNPIRVQGAEIEPVLVTRLVNDVGDNPDQLSILQHALNRTWANWQEEGGKGPLALRHYEVIGTMAHALDAHAEEAYAELATTGQEPSRRQLICEKLFQALTDKATDGRGVRRPTTLGSLCALTEATESELKEVIEVFRHPSRSFLMPPAGENLKEEKVIDISHESLMRVWERLKRWVEEEAEAAQIYRRLADNSALHARGEASTLRDPELTIYQNWQQKRQPNAAWAERYADGFDGAMGLLQRSALERDAEQAEREMREKEEAARKLEEEKRARINAEDRQRVLLRGLVGMSVLALLAGAGGISFWHQLQVAQKAQAAANEARIQAQISRKRADDEAIKASQKAVEAERSEAKAKASLKHAKTSQQNAMLQQGIAENQKTIADQQAANAQEQSRLALREKDLAEKNLGLTFAATAKAQLSIDPFDAVVNGLAAMGPLASDPGESIGLTETLAKAVTQNWQIGSIATGQRAVLSLIELKNGELISGGKDGSLRRWRDGKPVGDGKPILTGQERVESLIELKNGELISGGKGGYRRWRDGKPVGDGKLISTGQGWVTSLLELKNGELITGGGDGSLRWWRNGEPVGPPIQTDTGDVTTLIELKNGEVISGGANSSLLRWRNGKPVGDGKPILTGQGGQVTSLIELKNGELISGGKGGYLRWRDGKPVGDGKLISTGQGWVTSLLELKNGELITGGDESSLRRWSEGEPVGKAIPTGQDGVLSLILLKNGELISGGADGSLRRLRKGKPVVDGKLIPTGQGQVTRLIELKNGELISGGRDGTLRRWRDGKPVDDGKPILTGQGQVTSLIELKNGDLISGGDSDGSLRQWRNSKRLGEEIDTGQSSVLSLIELKNGELISGGSNGSLRRWRNAKRMGKEIDTGQRGVSSLIELKNGELISGGKDGSLRRWRDGKPVGDGKPILTGQYWVLSLIEMKNGELISGGYNGSLRRWRYGKPVGDGKPIDAAQGNIFSLIELKNGELISGGSAGSLRRWRDGKPVGDAKPIPTGQDGVFSLIKLKNGELISGGGDGTLKIFLPRLVIAAACHQLHEHPALIDPQTAAETAARTTCQSGGYLK